MARPVLALAGMRFQQSCSDLPPAEISTASPDNRRAILERAVAAAAHPIETATATAAPNPTGPAPGRRW